MPNGFHGKNEEWDRIEAPLRLIDDSLRDFAKRNSLQVSRNYHNWPERSLTWSDRGVRKLIQVYLQDDKAMTFNFWLCAHLDKHGARHWKQLSLKKNAPFTDIRDNLVGLLEEGLNVLSSWNEADLEIET